MGTRAIRLLHTSDWHLGARLGRFERLPDQLARIREIGAYAIEREVDAVLVAGDVIDELSTRPLATIVNSMVEALAPVLEARIRVVFLAGNHDREHVFPLFRGVLKLGATVADRVSFVHEPGVLDLPTRSGRPLLLALAPYPLPARYSISGSWESTDARNRAIATAVRRRIRELGAELKGRDGARVLVGHLLLTGMPRSTCGAEHEDPRVNADAVRAFDYVALGHIHQPTRGKDGLVRYCGSIERMDLGEEHDRKQVVLVEIGESGVACEDLPLDASPFATVTASSVEDLEGSRAGMKEPERTFVSLSLRVGDGASPFEMLRVARELFPRLYKHTIERTAGPLAPPPAAFMRPDPRETVREYLRQKLASDEDREELLSLAETILTRGD